MELMKQGVHETLPVAKQVAAIYAGTHGYLDDLPVSRSGAFEAQLYEALDRGRRRLRQTFNAEEERCPTTLKAALERVLQCKARTCRRTRQADPRRRGTAMPTLKDYNDKLARLRNTRKMTKTMKMVSATKLRTARRRPSATRGRSRSA